MISMVRRLMAVVAIGGLAMAITVSVSIAADKDKHADIETIMKKVNGKKGLCATCSAAGKASNWEDSLKAAKELKNLTADLGKNDPPKGDKASWEKLTKQYAKNGAAIYDAAEKKDAEALGKSVGVFLKSCKTCHDAHK